MAKVSVVPQITICKTSRGIKYKGNWDIKAMLEDVKNEEEEKDAVAMKVILLEFSQFFII